MRLSRWSRGKSSETPLTIGKRRSSPRGRSRMTPCASISANSLPLRAKATGVRSVSYANAIRQNSLHAGGFDPGDLLDGIAACVQRNTKNASIAVMNKLLQHGLAADDVISGQLNLIRLEQEHRGRIKKKTHPIVGCRHANDTGESQKQQPAIKQPS